MKIPKKKRRKCESMQDNQTRNPRKPIQENQIQENKNRNGSIRHCISIRSSFLIKTKENEKNPTEMSEGDSKTMGGMKEKHKEKEAPSDSEGGDSSEEETEDENVVNKEDVYKRIDLLRNPKGSQEMKAYALAQESNETVVSMRQGVGDVLDSWWKKESAAGTTFDEFTNIDSQELLLVFLKHDARMQLSNMNKNELYAEAIHRLISVKKNGKSYNSLWQYIQKWVKSGKKKKEKQKDTPKETKKKRRKSTAPERLQPSIDGSKSYTPIRKKSRLDEQDHSGVEEEEEEEGEESQEQQKQAKKVRKEKEKVKTGKQTKTLETDTQDEMHSDINVLADMVSEVDAGYLDLSSSEIKPPVSKASDKNTEEIKELKKKLMVNDHKIMLMAEKIKDVEARLNNNINVIVAALKNNGWVIGPKE